MALSNSDFKQEFCLPSIHPNHLWHTKRYNSLHCGVHNLGRYYVFYQNVKIISGRQRCWCMPSNSLQYKWITALYYPDLFHCHSSLVLHRWVSFFISLGLTSGARQLIYMPHLIHGVIHKSGLYKTLRQGVKVVILRGNKQRRKLKEEKWETNGQYSQFPCFFITFSHSAHYINKICWGLNRWFQMLFSPHIIILFCVAYTHTH